MKISRKNRKKIKKSAITISIILILLLIVGAIYFFGIKEEMFNGATPATATYPMFISYSIDNGELKYSGLHADALSGSNQGINSLYWGWINADGSVTSVENFCTSIESFSSSGKSCYLEGTANNIDYSIQGNIDNYKIVDVLCDIPGCTFSASPLSLIEEQIGETGDINYANRLVFKNTVVAVPNCRVEGEQCHDSVSGALGDCCDEFDCVINSDGDGVCMIVEEECAELEETCGTETEVSSTGHAVWECNPDTLKFEFQGYEIGECGTDCVTDSDCETDEKCSNYECISNSTVDNSTVDCWKEKSDVKQIIMAALDSPCEEVEVKATSCTGDYYDTQDKCEESVVDDPEVNWTTTIIIIIVSILGLGAIGFAIFKVYGKKRRR